MRSNNSLKLGDPAVNLSFVRRFGLLAFPAIVVAVFLTQSSGVLVGQGSKKKVTPPSPIQLRQLELARKKTLEEFVTNTVKLSVEYERVGLLEESKKLLQTVQKIEAGAPGLKKQLQDKLDSLENSIMSENPFQFELDTSKGWGDPIARVQKGKPIRIQSAGNYRFQLQTVVGPKGFPTEDPIKEMAKGVRCGALMALIVPVDDKGKPGKPSGQIEIGEGREITPKDNGLLFLSINAPLGHKCTGDIDIQLSGYVRPPQ
jgi:hypothetical protein